MKVNLIAHHTDNGDGSSTVTLYNSREELAADLAEHESETTIELIDSDEDHYEHGSLSTAVLELDADFKLTKPVRISSDG